MLQNNFITERKRNHCMVVFDAVLNCDMEEHIYCAELYNDEIHTFDQVINTLTRIVGWKQK